MAKTMAHMTGVTGEHYVAAYLSAHGVAVGVLRGGAPCIDLVAARVDGVHAVSIQVKTGQAPHRASKRTLANNFWFWDTPLKAADVSVESLWYVFVDLNGWPASSTLPRVFFVPSTVVAKCLAEARLKGEKRSTFWMNDADALQWQGESGYAKLSAVLGGDDSMTN